MLSFDATEEFLFHKPCLLLQGTRTVGFAIVANKWMVMMSLVCGDTEGPLFGEVEQQELQSGSKAW